MELRQADEAFKLATQVQETERVNEFNTIIQKIEDEIGLGNLYCDIITPCDENLEKIILAGYRIGDSALGDRYTEICWDFKKFPKAEVKFTKDDIEAAFT